jgi:hypothetical protein
MKKVFTICTIFMVALAMEAQTVAVVDYMKVPTNGGNDYVAIEQQWKTLHQNLVEAGRILGWQLYYVRNSGTDSPYNYTTVTIFENFAQTESWVAEDDLKKAFGDKMDDFLKKTEMSRNLIMSETYWLQLGIPSDIPDKFILVNSIQTDNLENYINMEKVGYMPLHQEVKNQGHRNSWGIWTRFPNADNNIQAVAVDGFTNFQDLAEGDYGKILENMLSTKKANETYAMMSEMNKTEQIRKIVKSEIWDLLDITTPKAK